jgi:ribosomal protein L7/L12
MANLNEQERQAIEAAIFAGQRIEAIKLHRNATGSDLAGAKKAVEDLEVELRRNSPEKFAAGANKKGCVGVLVCTTLIAAGTVLISFFILR